jgi:hypothetical protein
MSIDEERKEAILFLITIYPDITLADIVKKLKEMFPEPVSGIYMSVATVRKIINDLLYSEDVIARASKFHKQRPVYTLSNNFVGINLKREMTKASTLLSKAASKYAEKADIFPKRYLRSNNSKALSSYRKLFKASLAWDIISPSVDGIVSAVFWGQIVTSENQKQFDYIEKQFKKTIKSVLNVVLVDEDGPQILPLILSSGTDQDFIANLGMLTSESPKSKRKGLR